MKFKFLLCMALAMSLFSCSKNDEPGNGNQSDNNSKVTINANGTTSTGVSFSSIDETSFYLDYVKYKIVDSHLEIVGYDPIEIGSMVTPYATVVLNGTSYNTRVVGKQAFCDCENMTEINLPNTVTTIDDWYAFGFCVNLKKIRWPKELVRIGDHAFSDCTSLENVEVPDGIIDIPYALFDDCTNLKNVILSPKTQSIGALAFAGCTSLMQIVIPGTVKEIRQAAFSGCESLTDIYVSGMPKCEVYVNDLGQLINPVFSWYTATLHVTKENYEWIKQAPVWSNFENIVADYNP